MIHRAIAVLALATLAACAAGRPLLPSPTPTNQTMTTQHASGSFEVKMEALEVGANTPPNLGRRSLDKKYRGDLVATGRGEMMSAFGQVEGSAGYVAIEFVSGSLQGKKGNFVLQHTGTMTRGAPQLSITVVPDSGTDELEGLAGSLVIKIEEGKHLYSFDYTLPAPVTH